MDHDPTRTYAQIKIDEEIPEILVERTYVYFNTDVREEPENEEHPSPEGYKQVSYISEKILKKEWDASRASHDDISAAEARANVQAWEMILAVNAEGGAE